MKVEVGVKVKINVLEAEIALIREGRSNIGNLYDWLNADNIEVLCQAVRASKIFCDHKMLTTGNSIGKQGTLSPELMQLGMALSKIEFGDDRNES